MNELDDPDTALHTFSEHCNELLILEVSVDSGIRRNDDALRYRENVDRADIRASIAGRGCFPTRRWVFNRLRQHFAHVYMTIIQSAFDRFRIDWREASIGRQQDRVIFIAAREPLANLHLVDYIPDVQRRER